jgi:hypothetical protein
MSVIPEWLCRGSSLCHTLKNLDFDQHHAGMTWQEDASLDMSGWAHALVQNAYNAKVIFARSVYNEVRSDRVDQMSRGQVVSKMA